MSDLEELLSLVGRRRGTPAPRTASRFDDLLAPPPSPDVARTIRRVRREADLSQAELAARLGVCQSTIARWENGVGEPTVTMFARIVAQVGGTVQASDAAGAPLLPMRGDELRDAARRLLPAHLDPVDSLDAHGERRVRVVRRASRDFWRRIHGVVPDDHPTAREVEERRSARRGAVRRRVTVLGAEDAAHADWPSCDCPPACDQGQECVEGCPCACEQWE